MNQRLYECFLAMGLTPELARLACANSGTNPQNNQTGQSHRVDVSDAMEPMTSRYNNF
jgi:hypothetical protein